MNYNSASPVFSGCENRKGYRITLEMGTIDGKRKKKTLPTNTKDKSKVEEVVNQLNNLDEKTLENAEQIIQEVAEMKPKYQRYPDMEGQMWEEFKQDIKENGVQVAAVCDETGETIDGHQRIRACKELGIECPKSTVKGLTEEEKIKLADTLNLKRRHLTPEQRIERRDCAEEEYQQLRREAEKATKIAKQAEQEAREAARKAQEAKDEAAAKAAIEAQAKAAEAKAKAAEAKAAQATREEVAEKYGTTAEAMKQATKREEKCHDTFSAKSRESKEEAAQRAAQEVRENQKSIRQVAKETGIPESTLRNKLKKEAAKPEITTYEKKEIPYMQPFLNRPFSMGDFDKILKKPRKVTNNEEIDAAIFRAERLIRNLFGKILQKDAYERQEAEFGKKWGREYHENRPRDPEAEKAKWEKERAEEKKQDEAFLEKMNNPNYYEDMLKRMTDGMKRCDLSETEQEICAKIITAGFKALTKESHPDVGGTNEGFVALKRAKEFLMVFFGGKKEE
jgi:ParB-like chromosome segregation protein Spo0J